MTPSPLRYEPLENLKLGINAGTTSKKIKIKNNDQGST